LVTRASTATLVLIVHGSVTVCLIVCGSVLVAMHAIGQSTLLAMISGGVGLLSGGGTALALQSAIQHGRDNGHADHH
jgi:Na+/glutamate symporter